MADAGDAEIPSILAAVITWEATDQDVDAVDVEDAEVAEDAEDADAVDQTTGVLPVPCAPTAKEDSVPQSLAQDVTPAAAQVSRFPVNLAPP